VEEPGVGAPPSHEPDRPCTFFFDLQTLDLEQEYLVQLCQAPCLGPKHNGSSRSVTGLKGASQTVEGSPMAAFSHQDRHRSLRLPSQLLPQH
jgi:hypothetical protein